MTGRPPTTGPLTIVGARFHGDLRGLEDWTTEGSVLDELAALGVAPTFAQVPFREFVIFDPNGREHRVRSDEPIFHIAWQPLDRLARLAAPGA